MWPALWPGDVINDVMNMYLHNCSHNLTIPLHRKFCDDIFACFLVITKNVVISFIKEYRGPTLRSPCDVIDDVIIMKILFLAKFGTIFPYLRSDWSCVKYFKIFKMATILSSRQTFLPEIIAGSWIYQKDSHEHFRHFELLIDALAQILAEIYQFQNLTYFVILWRHQWRHECITCTTRHPQQCTCKILFVWHQSFIVKSSGQTSWQT